MSTRSLIGIQEKDGSVRFIYNHHDGYPSYTGRMLKAHYNTPERIKELMDLGDISVLDENIGGKIDFDDYETRKANKQVLAYGRDRNESGSEAKTTKSPTAFRRMLGKYWSDYLYLYTLDGRWVFSGGKAFQPLTAEEIKKD